jgi:hypothetical protein
MTAHRSAAVLVTAAAALIPLLSGCGSDTTAASEATAHVPGRALSSASASAPAADPGGALAGDELSRNSSTGTSSGTGGTGHGRGAVLPDDELTPATGTFSKRQKRYLEGRVPVGIDPAAILQAGQETCDRLERVARTDRDAAAGATIAGDIKGAAGAIEHLCTDLKPLLSEVRGGLADGTHNGPAAGRYRALTPTAACSWQLDGASGTKTTVTIPSGAKSFSSSGCYAWARR